MQTLAQLESKILDLQSQIQATQTQITDYQTNPIYIKQAWGCGRCGDLVFDSSSFFCENPICPADSTFYYAPFFTKVSELAQAQAQLATLQNELKATQSQYEQVKESTKPSTDKPTTPTNPTISPELDSILTPPPKQDTSKHKSYKRDRFSKAIFADDKLKILCAE